MSIFFLKEKCISTEAEGVGKEVSLNQWQEDEAEDLIKVKSGMI